MARAEAYLHAKFHLHPSNRLATDRTDTQDRQTNRQQSNSIGQTVLERSPQPKILMNKFIRGTAYEAWRLVHPENFCCQMLLTTYHPKSEPHTIAKFRCNSQDSLISAAQSVVEKIM